VADRYGVAVGYAVLLGLGSALLHAQPEPVRARWLDWASTNLANATDHPFSALVVSAFLASGDLRGWLVLSLVGIGTLGVTFGAWRTGVLIAAAHVLGTVLSEGLLGLRIALGAVPPSQVHVSDVGPSYVVAGALVAGIAYARWPGRLLCVAGFAVLAPSLFGGLSRLELSAVGHVCAIMVALVTGQLVHRRFTVAPGDARGVSTRKSVPPDA
jgi:hypothetical protein